MNLETANVNGSVVEFYTLLREMRGISLVAEKMIRLNSALTK